MNFFGKKIDNDRLIILELLAESISFPAAQALMSYVGLTYNIRAKDLLWF